MTQRIFDTDDRQDMLDLWDILPNHINKIKGETNRTFTLCLYNNNICCYNLAYNIFSINWHGKTEITRPIQEATEQDIDKLCVFWDDDDELPHYGILDRIDGETYHLRINISPYTECYHHCRRLTKQEIEELC